ncbi:GGDEF domain-containing protein [Rhizobium oryzicola]|uniref:diguanylate cyclase n=1 Tax=Rhizobium oryzicola TaxID=1232668 RepID=A0ABT8T384_9HYPH|nr:GGDEF domain-containing protein [Rhizobium oryzicola]MDO1585102.1 GGDEF domain-containing protein [Rhizobium oryzicola]
MSNATFLLVINASIGLTFALAFFVFSLTYKIRLGLWCAASFGSATLTVCVEAIAPHTRFPELISALSFSTLLTALALIAAGVHGHYRPNWPRWPIALAYILLLTSHGYLYSHFKRDSFGHAFSYQMPFAVMTIFASVFILASRRRSVPDLFLLLVMVASTIQFFAKAVLAERITTGENVHSYIFSAYAHYSQTLGAILSMPLGVSFVMVIAHEAMKRTRDTLQLDHLSGVWNRGGFLEKVAEALRQNDGDKEPAAVILCDLDHFKGINDSFGHDVGDDVIRAFAGCLRDAGGDICGRLGGEEFAVVFARSSTAKVRLYVEKVQGLFAKLTFQPLGLHPTASFGIALFGADETLNQAMRRADMALYEAKAAGRNTFRIAALSTVTMSVSPDSGTEKATGEAFPAF